jgi:hypothetical protein
MDWKRARWPGIVAGAGLFGTLMAFRAGLDAPWARILVAAMAGGVMGVMLVGAWKKA